MGIAALKPLNCRLQGPLLPDDLRSVLPRVPLANFLSRTSRSIPESTARYSTCTQAVDAIYYCLSHATFGNRYDRQPASISLERREPN